MQKVVGSRDLYPDYPDHVASTFTLQDFTVIDAHRLPTSKDQCKNGGWRTYGVFKNQGDCVSFVATRGKNPPGTKP
jgi:hypothetical protein